MKGMVLMFCALLSMMATISPISICMVMTLCAIMTSIQMVSYSSETFPATAVTISFSSGMMILFFYCSSLSNFEKKMGSSTMVAFTMAPMMAISGTENTSSFSVKMISLMSSQENFTMVAMMVVILAMVSVNKSIFKPNKTMIMSY